MDEAVVDYCVLGSAGSGAETDGGARVLLAAARAADVEERLRPLAAAGIAVSGVDAELVALVNAAETVEMLNAGGAAGEAVCAADFGASKTLIAVTDGTHRLFREFPVGAGALAEMVERRFGCGVDRAEELLRAPGDELDTVRDAIHPGLEDITAEIRACIDSFKKQSGGNEAKRLVLSGGLAAFSGLARFVGRLTRTEARVFAFPEGVLAPGLDTEYLAGNAHLFAVAFGLACHAREEASS
jgi:type IV pilus assembly protein PilM